MQPKVNIAQLIPQLFYDLIARIVPGIALLAYAFMLAYGPRNGLHVFTTWADPTATMTFVSGWVVLPCNMLAAYVLGALLGGLWFRLYRYRPSEFGSLASAGEDRIDQMFASTFKGYHLWVGPQRVDTMGPTQRVAFMYDLIQYHQPSAGIRIAKLRAEKHMAGILGIGFLVLALVTPFRLAIAPGMQSTFWWIAEALLVFGAIGAFFFAWHLEKRSGTGLYYTWYAVLLDVFRQTDLVRIEITPEYEHELTVKRARAIWERECNGQVLSHDEEAALYFRALDEVRRYEPPRI